MSLFEDPISLRQLEDDISVNPSDACQNTADIDNDDDVGEAPTTVSPDYSGGENPLDASPLHYDDEWGDNAPANDEDAFGIPGSSECSGKPQSFCSDESENDGEEFENPTHRDRVQKMASGV